MVTKYDIGDVVMVPATVNRVTISCKGNVFYDMINVVNSNLTGLSHVPEEDIIGLLANYDKRNDRTIPRELIDKKLSLIKQLREANGFSANEIALIMNMDECAVLGILSNNES